MKFKIHKCKEHGSTQHVYKPGWNFYNCIQCYKKTNPERRDSKSRIVSTAIEILRELGINKEQEKILRKKYFNNKGWIELWAKITKQFVERFFESRYKEQFFSRKMFEELIKNISMFANLKKTEFISKNRGKKIDKDFMLELMKFVASYEKSKTIRMTTYNTFLKMKEKYER